MPDRHTLAETEKAMSAHVSDCRSTFLPRPRSRALPRRERRTRASDEFGAARARTHLDSFVVLWVVWIWDGAETRHAAENAAISKATLTGVVKTLEARGLITRRVSEIDRRLVHLELTPAGRI